MIDGGVAYRHRHEEINILTTDIDNAEWWEIEALEQLPNRDFDPIKISVWKHEFNFSGVEGKICIDYPIPDITTCEGPLPQESENKEMRKVHGEARR